MTNSESWLLLLLAAQLALVGVVHGQAPQSGDIVIAQLDGARDTNGTVYERGYSVLCHDPRSKAVWAMARSFSSLSRPFFLVFSEDLEFQTAADIPPLATGSRTADGCVYLDGHDEMWLSHAGQGLTRWRASTLELLEVFDEYNTTLGPWPWHAVGLANHHLDYAAYCKQCGTVACFTDVVLSSDPRCEHLVMPVPGPGETLSQLRPMMRTNNHTAVLENREYASFNSLNDRYLINTSSDWNGVVLSIYDMMQEKTLQVYTADAVYAADVPSQAPLDILQVDAASNTIYGLSESLILHRIPFSLNSDGSFDQVHRSTRWLDLNVAGNGELAPDGQNKYMEVLNDQVYFGHNNGIILYVDGRTMTLKSMLDLNRDERYNNTTFPYGAIMTHAANLKTGELWVPNWGNSALLKLHMEPAEPSDTFPWWLVILLGAILLVAAITAAVVVARRNRNSNLSVLDEDASNKDATSAKQERSSSPVKSVSSAATRKSSQTSSTAPSVRSAKSMASIASKQSATSAKKARSGSVGPGGSAGRRRASSNMRGKSAKSKGKSVATSTLRQDQEAKDLARQSIMTTASAMTTMGSGDDYGHSVTASQAEEIKEQFALAESRQPSRLTRSTSSPRIRSKR